MTFRALSIFMAEKPLPQTKKGHHSLAVAVSPHKTHRVTRQMKIILQLKITALRQLVVEGPVAPQAPVVHLCPSKTVAVVLSETAMLASFFLDWPYWDFGADNATISVHPYEVVASPD